MVARFDVYLVNLDETPSKDAKNTRPSVVLSPDEMNRHVNHVVIAPISSPGSGYPTRIPIDLLNSPRAIILDQLRTVDKDRLVKKIGEIDKQARKTVIERLQEFFAE
ncbi:MAG: type II toxin-antitoxin system PemK/MazF family toxin [Acidobacteria bacterium]|nr:type II toxin-antitoxin system PemK/MazF family toxin [Acidobacteriota bacterium]